MPPQLIVALAGAGAARLDRCSPEAILSFFSLPSVLFLIFFESLSTRTLSLSRLGALLVTLMHICSFADPSHPEPVLDCPSFAICWIFPTGLYDIAAWA